jgi:hypothetical protein
MKKGCFLLISIVAMLSRPEQDDLHRRIETDDGTFILHKTAAGNDMISMSALQWDAMVGGTKYISQHLSFTSPRKICIEIAGKKRGQCKTGIGFSCSIFDCGLIDRQMLCMVNNENRICSVTVIKQSNATVKIIFLDKVNWQSLQNISSIKK